MKDKSAVVLADGSFPVHEIPLGYLRNSRHIVCCDGSAESLINAGLEPYAIVGDLDSIDNDISEKYKDRLAYVTIDGKEYPCGIRLSADDNEFVKTSGLYSSCTVGVCCDSSPDAMVNKLCGYILH